ncbi:MAG: hypothetical protein ACRD4U_01600 [Candidatus Acidiferrales bacterium]
MSFLATFSLVASLILLLTYLIILIKAFRDEWVQGALCILLPIYTLYYAAVKMEGEHKGLLVTVLFGSLLAGPVLQYTGLVTPKDDACQLLTKGDVEMIMREPVDDRPERRTLQTDAGEAKLCGYQTSAVPFKMVAMGVIRDCPAVQPLRDRIAGVKFDLSDVGDEAFYTSSGLVTRSGNTCFIFHLEETGAMSTMSAYDKLAVNRRLAEAAMARLPQ